MARYEVVAGIYKKGVDEALEEETLFETDALAEAQEFMEELSTETGDEPEDEALDEEEEYEPDGLEGG